MMKTYYNYLRRKKIANFSVKNNLQTFENLFKILNILYFEHLESVGKSKWTEKRKNETPEWNLTSFADDRKRTWIQLESR